MLADAFRKPLTVGQALVLLAVTAALVVGATSIAAIPGPDGRVKACVKKRAPNKGALRAIDHNKRCSRNESTLTWNQKGPQGEPGAAGAQGAQGGAGQNGAAGANGSPDTGSDILGKLAPVDGAESGLDADSLDGRPSSDFLPARTPNFDGGTSSQLPLSWAYYDFNTLTATPADFPIGSGFIHLERTGDAGEMRVCVQNDDPAAYNVPFTVRIPGGADVVGTLANAVGTNETCSADIPLVSRSEFTVYVQGAVVHGTPLGSITQNIVVNNRWRLMAFAF